MTQWIYLSVHYCLIPKIVFQTVQKVSAMSRLASILSGDFAIGSILDLLGNLILNDRRIDVQYRWVIESPTPGIIEGNRYLNYCKLVFYLSIQWYFWDGANLTLFSSFYDFHDFWFNFDLISIFTIFDLISI